MRRLLSIAVIAAASLSFVARAGAQASPDAIAKCRSVILKQQAAYSKAIATVLQKCNAARVKAGSGSTAPGGSDVFGCDTKGKISLAESKLELKIVAGCFGLVAADVDWPTACPNLENGTCDNSIAFTNEIAACVDCVTSAALRQVMDLDYLALNDSSVADVTKCQAAIGKVSSKFLLSKLRALQQCRKKVDAGIGTLPCPVPGDGKAGPAITKAQAKAVVGMCKACGTASSDGTTCDAGGETPATIGFAATCPLVHVPGGMDCGAIGTIDTLTKLVQCVDCVSEYKVDCLDALVAPQQTSYPVECNPPLPTPTPTLTSTATPTASSTPTPTATATVTATPTATATPIPDLVPTLVTGPAAATVGSVVSVGWTVQNQGTGTAVANWVDRIRLSTDAVYDDGDVFLTGLVQSSNVAGGGSYTRSTTITVPNVAPGNYFLVVATDVDGVVNESNEANNVTGAGVSVPITIQKPNLVPTAVTGPATATVGSIVTVGWTVENQDTGTALANWADRLRLSTDDAYDNGDVFLTDLARSSNLAGGSNYTRSTTITVPNVAPGNYFLVLATDADGAVNESNETDNGTGAGVSVPITIQKPNLVPTAVTGPATATVGSIVTVGWTVENQDTGTALANWADRLRLSTDDAYDNGDVFLTDLARSSNLAGGSNYTRSTTITVPNVAPGNYFLVLATDADGAVNESNETDNGTSGGVSLPITVQP